MGSVKYYSVNDASANAESSNGKSANEKSLSEKSAKSSREEQKVRRNQEILETALDIFIRKGFAGTRIQDIAEAAGMSTGLLFHYYDSKEKLYEALVRIGLEGTKHTLSYMPSGSASGVAAIGFFEKNADMILDLLKSTPFAAKIFVLMGQVSHSEAVSETVRNLIADITIVRDSIPIIEAGQRQGTIREGNSLALSSAFWSAIQGIAEQIAMSPDIPYPEPDWLVDILRKRSV